MHRPKRLVAILAAVFPCLAAAAPEAVTLDSVVVTGSRVEHSSFDLPVAVDVVDAERIGADQARVNASEALAAVPGISVQNRQNYAQDLQISSRGFGARSAFGVRGIRLISDGIPASMPDGQGRHIALEPMRQHLHQGHRAVLTPRTTDGKGVISTAFLLHQGKRPAQPGFRTLQEFAEFVGFQQVFLNGPIPSREGLEGFHVVRIRKEPRVQDHIRVRGNAPLEAEAEETNGRMARRQLRHQGCDARTEIGEA